MAVEGNVQFLNIDLNLFGLFEREPILAAMRDGVFVLHDDAVIDNEPCLVLDVLEPGLDLVKTLARLLEWVEGLSPAARRSWEAASRRVFDIGIKSGMEPHERQWTIGKDQVAALAKVGGEVELTVYGSERTRRRVASQGSRKGEPARRRRRGRSAAPCPSATPSGSTGR